MKKIAIVVLALVVILAVPATSAHARGGGGHGGQGGHGGNGGHGGHKGGGHKGHGHHHRSFVVVGGGVFYGPDWPYWYPPYDPAYYAAITSDEPVSYIQQDTPPFWYYCEGAQAYYPYVQECAGGWLTVTPTPSPDSPQP